MANKKASNTEESEMTNQAASPNTVTDESEAERVLQENDKALAEESESIAAFIEEERAQGFSDAIESMDFIVAQVRPILDSPGEFAPSEREGVANLYEENLQEFAVTFKLDPEELREEVETRFEVDSAEIEKLRD